MKRISLFVVMALTGLTLTVLASAALQGLGASEVHFLATGPAGLKINGTAGPVQANDIGGTLVLKSALAGIRSGIGLRDTHTKKYIKASQHPLAELSVERSQLKMPADKQTSTGTVPGKLALAGVTKPVTVRYTTSRTGSDYHVQGQFDLDIRQHGIEVPCYLGICVGPMVKVTAKFKLREQS